MIASKRAHNPNFVINLEFLCSSRASVSAICREIGINRQQFERYLKGHAVPSAHNLRRICVHFAVSEAQLLGDPTKLRRLFADRPAVGGGHPLGDALRPHPGELAILRNYIGAYHYFFMTPSWIGQVQCGFIDIREEEGVMRSRYVGRARDSNVDKPLRSRFEGQVVFRGDRIFIIEYARGVIDSFGQTILYAVHQHQSNYLTGMTFGIGWHPHRGPFASQVIIKRIHGATPIRQAIEQCGLYESNSRALDPIVRNFFRHQDKPFLIEG